MAKYCVCVPNEKLANNGTWQERAVAANDVIDKVMPDQRAKCEKALGEGVCGLEYRDITALASEIEEIGFAVCDKDLATCEARVVEAGTGVEVRLRGQDTADLAS